MKLGTLVKRALYKELMGSIGYYDARRVLKLIEKDITENDDVEKLSLLLEERGFDGRQRQYVTEAVKSLGLLSRKP
jgi:hypothetical protein